MADFSIMQYGWELVSLIRKLVFAYPGLGHVYLL